MVLSSDAARERDGRSGSLVIFTRVEGLLRERTHEPSVAADDPLRFLSRQGVPLVLVSAWKASEIRQLQCEFGFRQPFICEEGAALHVPQASLDKLSAGRARIDEDTEWEIFRFDGPSISAAFQLASGLFRAQGYDPLLTVGIGCALSDYALLTAVDIPIVVRGYGCQAELLRYLPGVYVTSATGGAGWSEAVLGTAP
jgi:predicted mannosyl-3-phosphoglycerate phosphatase (HAD superfamily)